MMREGEMIMTKKEAIKKLTDYMKVHNLGYHLSMDDGCPLLTTAYHVENAPGYCVESCVWFYGETAEARVYYSAVGAEVCRKSGCREGLLRLLNFINARVFLSCGDGCGTLYGTHMLYTPRIYMTEDDCYDITITTMIPYDFWEIAPIETADYLTAYCPELLDRLTCDIFGVLVGKITAEEAIRSVEREILGMKDE